MLSYKAFELIVNICFFALAAYLYAYFSGILNIKNPEHRKRQTELIKTSGKWFRPLTLALAAFSLMNILLQLLGR